MPTGVGGLHYLRFLNGLLCVAGASDERVYRYTLNAGCDLTLKDWFTMNDPVGITFSPDEQEMFATGQRTTDLIYRFHYNAQSEQWTDTCEFDAGSSLGDVLLIPSAPQPFILLPPNDSAVVSWTLPADGWLLEISNSLTTAPVPWIQVLPPYQTNGNNISVTFPNVRVTCKQFFRLHKP